MFGLGVPEIIVIAIIILLIFGAKWLPIIGESLGKTVKEIRNAKKEISGIKKSEAKKEVGESNESEDQSLESDIVDTVQKKVTKPTKSLDKFRELNKSNNLRTRLIRLRRLLVSSYKVSIVCSCHRPKILNHTRSDICQIPTSNHTTKPPTLTSPITVTTFLQV
ncbi:MAG: twin-arginine translocase TatA/TatE family subunit [Deltaproteobacteria bacterium]|nr:twin-arginine translocase TatA/TatE family subunit [Deltaproteobacteria bacterium]